MKLFSENAEAGSTEQILKRGETNKANPLFVPKFPCKAGLSEGIEVKFKPKIVVLLS